MNHKSEYKDMFKPFIKLEDNNIIKQYFGIKSWTLGLAVEEINGSQTIGTEEIIWVTPIHLQSILIKNLVMFFLPMQISAIQ